MTTEQMSQVIEKINQSQQAQAALAAQNANCQLSTYQSGLGSGFQTGIQVVDYTIPSQTYTNDNLVNHSFGNLQYTPFYEDKTRKALEVLKKLKALDKIDFDDVDEFVETLEAVRDAL